MGTTGQAFAHVSILIELPGLQINKCDLTGALCCRSHWAERKRWPHGHHR